MASMFQQSILQTSSTAASSRRCSTFIAVSVQVLLVAAAIIVPRLYIEALPLHQGTPEGPVIISAFHPEQPINDHPGHGNPESPSRPVLPITNPLPCISCNPMISGGTSTDPNSDPPSVNLPCPPDAVCAAIPPIPPTHFVLPTPVPAVKKVVTISRLDPGALVSGTQPVYPDLPRRIGVQGTVYLHAIIATDGRISELEVVSGPPLLQKAARDAVSQWRYRPYVLNGQAVSVETTIQVKFTLQR